MDPTLDDDRLIDRRASVGNGIVHHDPNEQQTCRPLTDVGFEQQANLLHLKRALVQ